MKAILLIAALTSLQASYAQDLCGRIRKEVSENKKEFVFTTPFEQNDRPALVARRSFNTDPDDGYDNINIIFRLAGKLDDIYTKGADGNQVEKKETGLVVEFDDKTLYTNKELQIEHDISDDRIFSIRYADLSLTPESYKQFANRKIVKFTLAGAEETVIPDSSVSMLAYLRCLSTVQ